MLKYLVIESTKKHTHTMFLLPGYSCSMRSMKYYTRNINKRLSDTIGIKFIIPQAPRRNVTCYQERAYCWYNYFTDYCDKEEIINYEHVLKMTKTLKGMVETEAKENLANDYSKIFIAGNSQGACQALHLALSISRKLGGVVSFRGHVISNTSVENKQPVWASHGEKDDAIGYKVATKGYDNLKDNGYNVAFHSEKDLDHYEHSNKEFDSCGEWINNLSKSKSSDN
jgi:predicted esterase